MMMNHQQNKPENALKRANDLILQDQKAIALNVLYEVISNRRHRVWSNTFEEIMMKFMSLCVAQRKGKQARDGLIQYRSVCQQVNVNSLETVINHFLESAETKTKLAAQQSEEQSTTIKTEGKGAEWIEDHFLSEDSPEVIMMRNVSSELIKDRTDRAILQPWVKFLWEAYRSTLDVLRNNPKLENLYHNIAQKAFGFCQRYNRKAEFKRLAELLRNHMQAVMRQSTQPQPATTVGGPPKEAGGLSTETFQWFMQSRFKQLTVATALDLWGEAYRSIEDIHNNITVFGKTPKPPQMIIYFNKLAQIFLVAGNHLFHAVACARHANALSTKTDMGEEEKKTVASQVVLSALVVPFWDPNNNRSRSVENFVSSPEREKNCRITRLLGTTAVPSRPALLTDMVNKGFLSHAHPEVASLYDILEVDFHPLDICRKVDEVCKTLADNPTLAIYVAALQRTAVVRMIKQLAKVYSTMKFDAITTLVPWAHAFSAIEIVIMAVFSANTLSNTQIISIDYHSSTVKFPAELLASDTLSSQLATLGAKLSKAATLCMQSLHKDKLIQSHERERSMIFQGIEQAVEVERQHLLQRKVEIEDRRQEMERQVEAEMQAEAERKREEEERQQALEKERLEYEARRRAEEEAKAAALARERREAQKILDDMTRMAAAGGQKGKTGDVEALKKRAEADPSLLEDKDKLLAESKNLLLKDLMQREQRLLDEAKSKDYFERACREEEAALMQKWVEARLAADEMVYTKVFEESVLEHKADWVNARTTQAFLEPMREDAAEFKQMVMERRRAEAAGKRAEEDKRREEAKKLRAEMERGPTSDHRRYPEDDASAGRSPISTAVSDDNESPASAPPSGVWKPKSAQASAPPAPSAADDTPAPAPAPGRWIPPSERNKS